MNPIQLSGEKATSRIQRYIYRLTLSVAASCLLLLTIALAYQDQQRYLANLQQQALQALHSIQPQLVEETDRSSLANYLKMLDRFNTIRFAALYDSNGQLQVVTGAAEQEALPEGPAATQSVVIQDDSIRIVEPLPPTSKLAAYAVLEIDTSSRWERLSSFLLKVLGFSVALLLLGFLLTKIFVAPLIRTLGNVFLLMGNLADQKVIMGQQERTNIEEIDSLTDDLSVVLRELYVDEQRLKLALKGSNEGLWDWDMNQGKVYFDQRVHDILRYSKDVLVDDIASWSQQVHSDDRRLLVEAMEAHLKGETDFYEVEYRLNHPADIGIWVSVHGKVVDHNSDGSAARMAGTMAEITARKYVEQETHLLSEIFKNSNDAVVIFDTDFELMAMNNAFRNILGAGDNAQVGNNLSAFLSHSHHGEFLEKVKKILAETHRWDGEVYLDRRGNESAQSFWLTIEPVSRSIKGVKDSFIGTFSDVFEHKTVEDELRYLANFDPLTNLPNRRLFKDRINSILSKAERYERQFALIFIDLDGFKIINDSLGHSTGDELLVQVTRRLQQCMRESDTIARFGGDEFTVLLDDEQADTNAGKVAEKLLEAFKSPFEIGAHTVSSGASIGIAIYPSDGRDIESLMKNADVAMYEAKRGGRNRYQFFRAEMNDKAKARLSMESDLHHALSHGEFYPVFQPRVDLKSKKVVGAEMLLRWEHPFLGLISPAEFIPLAEECGLIRAIGEWTIDKACERLAAWNAEGLCMPSLAVNVSVKQFQDVDFASLVSRALDKYALDASQLELEITEGVLLDSGQSAVELLNNLKLLGVRLAIDDFGTGYSSLQYLIHFPIDMLKIDKSFVFGMGTDVKNIAIVNAVIAMADALELQVTAEGIESEPQDRLLQEFKCHFAQGFHYCAPCVEQDFLDYVRARLDQVS